MFSSFLHFSFSPCIPSFFLFFPSPTLGHDFLLLEGLQITPSNRPFISTKSQLLSILAIGGLLTILKENISLSKVKKNVVNQIIFQFSNLRGFPGSLAFHCFLGFLVSSLALRCVALCCLVLCCDNFQNILVARPTTPTHESAHVTHPVVALIFQFS